MASGGGIDRREFVAAWERLGYRFVREARHGTIYRGQGLTIQVPRHTRVKRGLAMRIVRDAGLTWEAFARNL